MQQVLAIDLCTSTVHAAIVRMDEAGLSVQQSHSIEIKPHEYTAAVETESEEFAAAPEPALQPLIDKFTETWSSVIVVMNDFNYLSLLLELPFGDSKTVEKIIDLELQDMVPFSVDDFVVDHRRIRSESNDKHLIHVSMIPRDAMDETLNICRSFAVEPHYVTTAGATLGGLYMLPGNHFSPEAVLLYFLSDSVIISGINKGQVYTDRCIPLPSYYQEKTGTLHGSTLENDNALRAEIYKTINHWQQTEKIEFNKYYCLTGDAYSRRILSSGFSDEVTFLDDLPEFKQQEFTLATLVSLFAFDVIPEELLTNFRVRDYAYRPQLRRLFEAMRELLVPLAFCFSLLAIYLGVSFYLEEQKIEARREAMIEEASRFIPAVSNLPPDQDIVAYVQSEAVRTERELKQLGSPSALTPLDSFLKISEAIAQAQSKAPDLDIDAIEIASNNIIVEGTAPDYSHAERLNRILEQNKSVFCQINYEARSALGRGNRGFRFSITLCEV